MQVPENTNSNRIRKGNYKGRAKGALNRRNRQILERTPLTGEMPHEILLRYARGHLDPEELEAEGWDKVPPSFRAECASKAAPYYIPRLAQIEAKVHSEVVHVIESEPLTIEQWSSQYATPEIDVVPLVQIAEGLEDE